MSSRNKPLKTAGTMGKRLIAASLMTLPALAGGGIGAGLGRPALWTGIAGLAAANHFRLPDWTKSLALGVAVNGVTTTRPVTQIAQTAEVTADGQLQGLIPDDFMTRSEQYYKNIAYSAYLDRVPVVNSALGLSGIDQQSMASFQPRKTARVGINASTQAELNRLMQDMNQGGIGNIDSRSFEAALSQGTSIDAAEFSTGGSSVEAARRYAAAVM